MRSKIKQIVVPFKKNYNDLIKLMDDVYCITTNNYHDGPKVSSVEECNHHDIVYNENVSEIIELGYKLLIENGFQIKPFNKNALFEIRKDKILHSDMEKSHAFPLHEDDYGGVSCKVETILFYLNNNLIGGDLAVKLKDINSYIILDTHSDHHNPQMVNSTNNVHDHEIKCILMSGNIEHCVTNMSGVGERIVVVIQFEYDGDNGSKDHLTIHDGDSHFHEEVSKGHLTVHDKINS